MTEATFIPRFEDAEDVEIINHDRKNKTTAEKKTESLKNEITADADQETGVLYVYHQPGSQSDRYNQLFRCPSDELDLSGVIDRVKNEYPHIFVNGEAKIRVQMRIKGQRGIAENDLITITLSKSEMEKLKNNQQLVPVQQGMNSEVLIMIEAMREQTQQFQMFLQQQNQPKKSVMEKFGELDPMVQAAAIAAIGKLAEQLFSKKEQPDPFAQAANVMGLIDGLEQRKKDPEESNGWADVAKGFLSAYTMAQSQNKQISGIENYQAEADPYQQFVEQASNGILLEIKNGKKGDQVAQHITENWPDQALDYLEMRLSTEEITEIMAPYVPKEEIQAHEKDLLLLDVCLRECFKTVDAG